MALSVCDRVLRCSCGVRRYGLLDKLRDEVVAFLSVSRPAGTRLCPEVATAATVEGVTGDADADSGGDTAAAADTGAADDTQYENARTIAPAYIAGVSARLSFIAFLLQNSRVNITRSQITRCRVQRRARTRMTARTACSH